MVQLRSDLAELTQRLVEMGKSEVSAARNRVRAEAALLKRSPAQGRAPVRGAKR